MTDGEKGKERKSTKYFLGNASILNKEVCTGNQERN